jgi:hypothetical protein
MRSPTDIEQQPARTVGRRRPPRSGLTLRAGDADDARRWREQLPTAFVPRGVYRFATHEQADEWLWTMITRPKKA